MLRFRRDEVPSASVIAWLAERRPIADLTLQEPPIERIVGEIYRRGISSLAATDPVD